MGNGEQNDWAPTLRPQSSFRIRHSSFNGFHESAEPLLAKQRREVRFLGQAFAKVGRANHGSGKGLYRLL